MIAVVVLPACNSPSIVRTVTLDALENAPPVAPDNPQRVVVADSSRLLGLCTALGPRLGLVQVRSRAQWLQLRQAAPDIGTCPDLGTGALVGLACWVGTPVDGHWPVTINDVLLHKGAGLLRGEYHGGNFLPDGVTYLEIAHVTGLNTVLAVDVSGSMFYPE